MPPTKELAQHAPAGLERKAASASPESGLLEADDVTGVVEAIVSVTGLLDEDRDVIKPGAYAKTLSRRRPKGIFVHDWSKWVARTEHVEELMPGDERLPKQTKNGEPWPTEAGGLYVKARFNLGTQQGRDAFSDVKFFSQSGECEWSIGYKVPPGKSVRTKTGERHIDEVDLYEYSPVLFGAAPLSGTLSVKSARDEDGDDTEELDPELLDQLDKESDEVSLDELDGDAAPDEGSEAEPGEKALEGKAEINTGGVNRDEALNPDTNLGEFSSGTRAATNLDGSRSYTNAFDQVVRITLTGDGYRVLVDDKIVTSPNGREDLTAEEAQAALLKNLAGDLLLPVQPTEGDTVTWRGATARVDKVDSDERAGVHATISFPGSETRRVPAVELSRPRQQSKSTDDDLDGKGMGTGLDRSPGKNWVEMTGRLPAYIEEIAKSIHEKRGMPLEQAIPIAIAQVKKWAAGGDDVNPDTRAKAAKAVAEWEALKAKNQARAKDAEPQELESTSYPFLPGTYEELREQVREQAIKALAEIGGGAMHVEVMGTWPDSAVVTAYQADGNNQSYEFPYSIVSIGEGRPESIELDEPVPVELKVSVGGQEEGGEGLLPYPSVINDVALDLKAMLTHAETKAGRVLSTVNEKRLLAAVENLVAVLKAAGLEIDASPRTKQEEEENEQRTDAIPYADSTAPSAQAVKALIHPALFARALRVTADEDEED